MCAMELNMTKWNSHKVKIKSVLNSKYQQFVKSYLRNSWEEWQ